MEFLAQLHPKLVHFPIALIICYTLFEAAGVLLKKDFLSKSAHIILAIAIIASVATVLTGDQALKLAEAWDDKGLGTENITIPFGLIHQHEDFATITLWYFAALLVIKTVLVIKKKFNGYFSYAVVLLAFTGCFFVYKTGELGGQLVYKYGVGTGLIKPADSTSTNADNLLDKEDKIELKK